jgi:excisionase family DNA binding protein
MAKQARDPGTLMTVEQVASYLQLNKLTVYKYIREGRLPAVKLGRSFRVLRVDVEGFLEAHRVAPVLQERRARSARRALPAERRADLDREALVAGRTGDTRVPVKHSDEIYVGPHRVERPRRALPEPNPLEWVIRGLH